MKIALDPAMYHAELSVPDEERKAAELGFSWLELSPRPDWFFWHRYPKWDRAEPGGAPVRLLRDQRRRGAHRAWPRPALGELRLLRAAHVPPLRRCGRRGQDAPLRRAEAHPRPHRRLLQPPRERGKPLHPQPARRRRPHPPAQRDRQRRGEVGRVLLHLA